MSTMGYVSTLEGATASASLSLDFEKQSYRVLEGGKQVNKGFDELFTFVRSTTGGRFNEKGVYETVAANRPRFDYDPITKVLKGLLSEEQRTNLVIHSENMSAFSSVRAEAIRNAALAPDGTYTAVKLVNDSIADWHFIRTNSITATEGVLVSASVFAKAGEYPRVRIASGDNTVFSRAAVFDLVSGTVLTGGSTASMTPVGNGWWRCTVALLGLKAGNAPFTVGAAKAGELDTNTSGDGGGLYLWGAQGELGGFPTTYIPTLATFTSRASTATYFDNTGVLRTAGVNVARTGAYLCDQTGSLVPAGLILEVGTTNLIKLSTDLSNSPWVRAPATVSITDGGVAPDGSVAQMFNLHGTTGHNINQTLSSALTVGTKYTLSVWLRSPNWGNKQFQMAYYDGGVVQAGAGGVVTPTSEWKRYEYTFVPTAVAAAPQIRLIGYGNGGDGDKVEIFGPQLEVGSYASSYTPSIGAFTGRASTATYLDSQGLIQTAAEGVSRSSTYRYDSSGVLRPNGLLLEASGTNLLSNSQDFTSPSWAQGGPGTVPVVVTPAAVDGPRGRNTMTSLKRGDFGIRYLSRSFSLPAGNLTFSQYVKATENGKFYSVRIQAGGSGNRVDARFNLVTGDISVSSIGEVTAPKAWMENMGGGLWRCIVSATSTGTWSSVLTVPSDRLMTVDSTPVELSEVYVDAAQIESSPFASSYIPTGSAQVTRSADVFNSATSTRASDVGSSAAATRVADRLSTTAISAWYNSVESTFTTEFTCNSVGTGNAALAIRMRSTTSPDASAVSLYRVSAGTVTGIVIDQARVVQMQANFSAAAPDGTRVKASIGYKLNSGAVSVLGKPPAEDTTLALPTPEVFYIGQNGSDSMSVNGYVHSVNYYPQRLPSPQLQIISE